MLAVDMIAGHICLFQGDAIWVITVVGVCDSGRGGTMEWGEARTLAYAAFTLGHRAWQAGGGSVVVGGGGGDSRKSVYIVQAAGRHGEYNPTSHHVGFPPPSEQPPFLSDYYA